MNKHLFGIFLVIFLLPSCKQSTPIVPQTPPAVLLPSPTHTCYITSDMTSTALVAVEMVPNPTYYAYFAGQEVETAVTGGFTKWDKVEVCGEKHTYIDDFERTITILLGDERLAQFVCLEETCPVTFTIPEGVTNSEARLVVEASEGGYGSMEYGISIRPKTPSP